MTLEEALEYLNLPASPRKKLVRKRYLELKRDYLKAIYNAPSDHFCTLYQENLEKIEEAYLLLSTHPGHEEQDLELNQQIEEIQKLISSVQKNSPELNLQSKKVIKQYIDRIEGMQKQLRAESTAEPQSLLLPSSKWETRQSLIGDQSVSTPPTWKWEIRQPKKKARLEEKTKNVVDRPTSYPLPINESNLPSGWMSRLLDKLDQAATTSTRKQLFSKFLLAIIIAVMVLSTIGLLYILFPLLFQG